MIRELKLKPDFEKTIARFEAWWVGEVIDRPPVTLFVNQLQNPESSAQNSGFQIRNLGSERLPTTPPPAEPAVESAIARLQAQHYVGDTFPTFWPNLGPEISATLFGCTLELTETTSWSKPVVQSPEDWYSILEMSPHFENLYWQAIERMTDYAIELCEGRYIVGITDLHGNYDILAALRDPMKLCEDLVDCPELVQRVGRHVSQAFVEAFNRLYAKVAGAGFGCTTWLAMYHEGPTYVPSCDFWCMVSPKIASEMILPDILFEMQPLERTIFHLDGPDALKHLDLILEIPQLNAVQWVYGAGQGPASRWLEVYRRIRGAGKSLQVLAYDAQDALNVLEALGPNGVWLTLEVPFPSVEEANQFLKKVQNFTAGTIFAFPHSPRSDSEGSGVSRCSDAPRTLRPSLPNPSSTLPPMTDRQRFHATMHYQARDRAPICDFGFWPETLVIWHDQGLPEWVNESNASEFFGMDRYEGGTGLNVELVPPFEVRVLEDRGDHEVIQQGDGVRVLRRKFMSSIPQPQGYLLTDRRSWKKYYKPRLDPDHPARYPANWAEQVRIWTDPHREYPLTLPGGSLYGWLRNWMGVENISYVVYDDPAWFEEMVETIADCILGVLNRALQTGGQFDSCGMWEDMCFNAGPLLSPTHFKRYLVPHYRRITDLLRRHGVDVIWVDCDGKIDALIPLWLEAGVNCMFPIEVGVWKADPIQYRKQYGKDLLLMGGFDKHLLMDSKQAIEKEIDRLTPLVEEGGYIPFCDHRVPPDVPLEHYLFYLETARRVWGRGVNLKPIKMEYLNLQGKEGQYERVG